MNTAEISYRTNRIYSWIVAGIFLLIQHLTVLAQPGTAIFDHLTVEDGLSQSEVNTIIKDADGFMWFGTVDGLNKYDGYTFTHYKNDPFDSTTLSHNRVLAMCVDRRGNLWVGTDQGLNVYDKRMDKFVRLFKHLQEGSGAERFRITSLHEDQYGTIWVGTAFGLKRLIPTISQHDTWDYKVQNYLVDSTQKESINSHSIRTIYEDQQGKLWIGTGNGLSLLTITNPSDSPLDQKVKFTHAGNSKNKIYQLNHPYILSITEDRNGNLWVGTLGGIHIIDATRKNKRVYTSVPGWPSQLTRQTVTSLLTDSEGHIWVGTLENGIFRVVLDETNHISRIMHYEDNVSHSKGLKSNMVYSLYESGDTNEDVVWIGTRGAGINMYSRTKNNFTWVNRPCGKDASLASYATFAIYTDQQGFLWIGSQEGLSRYNRKTGECTWYSYSPYDSSTLTDDFVSHIYQDKQGTLWVGTMYGLNRYDRKQNRFERIYFSDYPGKSKPENTIYTLYEDRDGDFWVGTHYDLKKYDRESGKTISYVHDLANPGSLQSYEISAIQEDDQGNLWIGTHYGLNKLDKRTGTFEHFTYSPDDPYSIISNMILSIMKDADGNLWIGTNKGINKLIYQNKNVRFIHYTEKDGLSNNYVYGALIDDQENIWMSTNLGLSRLTPATGKFRNFDVSDGLPNNEFNSGAYHRSASGELFFGGNGGIVYFDPSRIRNNRHVPNVRIHSFKKFEKPLNLDSILAASGEIQLSYKDNFFSFEFVALDYTNPKKNQYAYKLEGFHEDWVYSGNRRYASFTGLSPGEYIFRVKGSNSDGIWSGAQEASVKIVITPPFWKTYWFLLFVFVASSAAVWLLHERQVKSKVKRLMEMEKVKLAENERVRKLAAEDLHDEFGNRLTRISLLTELIKARLNGHGAEVETLLTKIRDNSNQLYQGTKDFIWSINPENDSLYEAAVRLKDFGDDLFDRTSVNFEATGVNEKLKPFTLPMGDSRHFILLFKEAMSNVLKHAACQSVQLSLHIQNTQVVVRLRDDGKGFERNQANSGNGLMNMQSRANKLKGKLSVVSEAGKGTFIELTLPLITATTKKYSL